MQAERSDWLVPISHGKIFIIGPVTSLKCK